MSREGHQKRSVKMKVVRGVLLALLGLTCLMQIVEGLASIANPAGMMAGLNLTMAPDVEVPLTFLGLAMIVRGAITAIAFVWLMKRKPEGLFLARFTALTILLSAPVVYLKLHRADFAIGDLVQGLLLLVPALVLKNNQ
jgi:hypothetical protein